MRSGKNYVFIFATSGYDESIRLSFKVLSAETHQPLLLRSYVHTSTTLPPRTRKFPTTRPLLCWGGRRRRFKMEVRQVAKTRQMQFGASCIGETSYRNASTARRRGWLLCSPERNVKRPPCRRVCFRRRWAVLSQILCQNSARARKFSALLGIGY